MKSIESMAAVAEGLRDGDHHRHDDREEHEKDGLPRGLGAVRCRGRGGRREAVSNVVNLNKRRKAKARAAARLRAAANSAKDGRTKAEVRREQIEAEKRERLLDQAKLEE